MVLPPSSLETGSLQPISRRRLRRRTKTPQSRAEFEISPLTSFPTRQTLRGAKGRRKRQAGNGTERRKKKKRKTGNESPTSPSSLPFFLGRSASLPLAIKRYFLCERREAEVVV